ncbi:MAG: pyrroline-5-carboxylate reductase [Myxococcota bacterium]|nr:pyrroline-5-carboxylate reductase [Myxococcota bacterium]
MSVKIGFIGCGNMGRALLDGWIGADCVTPADVLVSTRQSGERLKAHYGIQPASTQTVFNAADVVILAVKPQYYADVIGGLELSSSQTLISVMAGIETQALRRYSSGGPVIRVMPNLASAVHSGATVGYCSPETPLDIIEFVQNLFESLGAFAWLETEDQFHPGTALVGSGPAFMFRAMAAFVDAGVALGLEDRVCRELAIAMVKGSARLAESSTLELDALCKSVASPGGTTIAGLNALSAGRFEAIITQAVTAAASRSKELAEEGSKK